MSEEKVSLGNKGVVQRPEEPEVVPAASVTLPSAGLVYAEGTPLCDLQHVDIKAMTAHEEDILTSKALLKSGKAIDALLRSCVLNKGIDIDSMLSGDRNALLVAVRVTGYGQEYLVEVDCPKCGETSEHSFDLSKLPIKRLGVNPIVPHTNEFEFLLPVSGKRVTFKLLTGRDENDLSSVLDQSKKMGSVVESMVTTRLLFHLVSVEGERDRQKISRMISSMPARDSKALRSHMDKISPGIEMRQEMTCPKCEQVTEVDVPMGTEFFWPKA